MWQPSRMEHPKLQPSRLLPGRPCSVAAGLELIGDRWALLVVRELLFGYHRFDELARNTGAPRDRLAARLRDLESYGVLERRLYQERPPRYEYHLTQAGMELGPVIQALRSWGDRWAVDEPPMVFQHSCGHELTAAVTCSHCAKPLRPQEMVAESRVPGWEVRDRV